MTHKHLTLPPPLIELEIIRSTYCDQPTTDHIFHHLWKGTPDLVTNLANEELWPFPECRTSAHRKALYAITYKLRETPSPGPSLPRSRLAAFDLLHELSRRLRKALGLREIAVFGNPLATGPEGPFPPLAEKIVSHGADWRSDQAMTQELSDTICSQAYDTDPALMYELCEQKRHLIYTGEIDHAFDQLITAIKQQHNASERFGFRQELEARLAAMCALPSYEAMLDLLGDDLAARG